MFAGTPVKAKLAHKDKGDNLADSGGTTKDLNKVLSSVSKEDVWTFLAFILIGLALYICWVVLTRFIGFLESANPSVASAVIGTMATLLVAFWSNLYVQRQVKEPLKNPLKYVQIQD